LSVLPLTFMHVNITPQAGPTLHSHMKIVVVVINPAVEKLW
jgi:hypothetical protein